MKFITTRVHGYLDYLVGVLMIIAPWLFRFNRGGAETSIFVVLGIFALLYSLFTRYELGLVKSIPMGAHLTLDILTGLLLLVSPWLFGFADRVWAPHVIFGIVEIVVPLLTQTRPHRIAEAAPVP